MTLLRDPRVNRVVVVPNGILVQAQRDMPRLARLEEDLLKRHELLLGPRQPRLLVVDVHLDGLGPVDGPDVADAQDDVDGAVGRERALLEFRAAVLEVGVREAVAKGEEGVDLAALVVAVADVDALAVEDL